MAEQAKQENKYRPGAGNALALVGAGEPVMNYNPTSPAYSAFEKLYLLRAEENGFSVAEFGSSSPLNHHLITTVGGIHLILTGNGKQLSPEKQKELTGSIPPLLYYANLVDGAYRKKRTDEKHGNGEITADLTESNPKPFYSLSREQLNAIREAVHATLLRVCGYLVVNPDVASQQIEFGGDVQTLDQLVNGAGKSQSLGDMAKEPTLR